MTFRTTMTRAAVVAFVAAAAFASSIGGSAAKDWTEIRIGTEGAYPPFNYVDSNGELQGFDVEIANALCDAMQAKCTLVAQDWDGIIPALLAGKFDAIVASMSITEERKKTVDFTDRYYQTPQTIVGNKDLAEDVSPQLFSGKVIGAQSSTTQAETLETVYAAAGAEVKLYPTQDEANLDLASGRLDAIICDKFVIMDWLKNNGQDCCKLIGDVPNTTTETGIAVRQEDDDLREKINAAIKQIRSDGTYDKIRAKYFDFDIY